MLRKKCLTGLMVTAMVPFLASCGDGESDVKRHLLPSEVKEPSLSAEAQRVRDMQKVQFKYHNFSTGKDEWLDQDPHELSYWRMQPLCVPGDGTNTYSGTSKCTKAVLDKRQQLCVAEFLLQASQTRANPVVLKGQWENANYLEVLPQSHATNVGMLQEALAYANLAMNQGLGRSYAGSYGAVTTPSVIASCTGATPTDGSNPTGDGLYQANPFKSQMPTESTLADLTNETIVRAYEVGKQAAALAVENTLAVSDAERSSAVSATVASRRSWVQRDLSRLAAAQLLVGGRTKAGSQFPELNLEQPAEQFPMGFCPGKPLSAQAQRAVGLFRSAAPPPRWLLDATVSTATILHGPVDSSVGGGSVKARLADIVKDAALKTTTDLPQYYGLDINDFEEARQYLSAEIRAFARDVDETLVQEPGGDFLPYVALRVAAKDPPDAFYVALVAGQGDDAVSTMDPEHPGVLSLSTFRELGRQTATKFLKVPNNVGASQLQADKLKQTGAMLEQKLISEVPGRISLNIGTESASGGPQINITYAHFENKYGFSQFTILKGERALKCALNGTIEGRACEPSDIENGAITNLTDHAPEDGPTPEICASASRCLGGQISGPTGASLLSEKARVYLVNNGDTAGTDGAPGHYVLIGAMELRGPVGSSTDIPANSIDYAEAAEIMRPSKEWCNHPRHSCSGGSFDERLPLEDELSGENDGVESSWKHYLALAKQATAESDALGAAYVDSSLKVDENKFSESIRLEQQRQSLNAALEKLQDTCGTAVDAQKLLTLLAGAPDSPCQATTDCKSSTQVCVENRCKIGIRTCSDESPCPTSGICVSGVCTPDLDASTLANTMWASSDPDLRHIVNCLQGSNYSLVAIGDAPLCVEVSETGYCENSSAENPCPRLADWDKHGTPDDTSDDTPWCSKSGEALVKSGGDWTTTLDLFHSSTKSGNPREICDAIATLRDRTGNRKALLETIKSSQVFLPDLVADVTARLGFEGRLGSYSAVTLGGTPIYHTGSLAKGPHSGSWPCAPADGSGAHSPSAQASLKSQLINCGYPDQRALMNDRLMRAVMLARFVGHNPYGKGLYLPGQSFDITLNASVGNVTTIQGSVKEVLMDVMPFSNFSKTPGRVYTTTDQTSASMVAYKTVLNDAVHDLKVLDTANGKAQYFTLADFTVDGGYTAPSDFNGYWLSLKGVGQPWIEAMYAQKFNPWINVMEMNDPAATPQWFSSFGESSVRNVTVGAFVAGTQNIGGRQMHVSFPLVTVEQWFADLSTQFAPKSSKSSANRYLANTLELVSKNQTPPDLPGQIYADSNYAYQGRAGFDPVKFNANNMLDALELICLARAVDASGVQPDMTNPPSASTPDELPVVKAYLDETARRIENWAATFVLPNLPKAAADFAREKSKSGVVPALGGSYATAMTNLRASLVDFAEVAPLIAYELRQLGVAVDQARIATAGTDLSKELNQLNYEQTLATSAAACSSAIASSISSFGAAAAGPCTMAIVQSLIAAKQKQLNNAQQDLEKAAALNTFQEQLNTHAQALQSYTSRISKSLETLDGSIAELQRQRQAAQRALNEAIQIAAFTPTNAENISATLVRQSETAKVRYERAFENAKRMADLAKRAIEQRLGVLLADMHDDLPLVEAPRSWEATVCNRSGINWEEVRSKRDDVPDNYADAFLGEYVSKLERVVESYRMEHSFHEGADTAVVSLRDDVLNVRAPCNVQTANLLEHSSDLDAIADSDGRHGWAATGCAPRLDQSLGVPLAPQNCVSAQPFDGFVTFPQGDFNHPTSISNAATDTGGFRLFEVKSGKPNGVPCVPGECDNLPDSAWSQKLSLDAGTYRVSCFSPLHVPYPANAMMVATPQGNIDLSWQISTGRQVSLDGTPTNIMQQDFAIFRLPVATDVNVKFRVPGTIAAPMLEKIDSGDVQDADLRPISLVTTGSGTTLNLRSCEDTDGTFFRLNGWRHGEVPLCPDGFGGNCDKSQSKMYGYREIPFTINQRDIESGRILKKAGFALGNFNYRIESIALNFVGTGIRNCSNSDTPSTCYSGGFVPYSLDHVGPYNVRNHFGGNFEAKLFTGHIQTARGLAAERYLTNPLSSADDQLLKDYVRSELQGRPLDGNFVIRLWDNPDVDFNAIKDIQVVVKYRYWTRFD